MAEFFRSVTAGDWVSAGVGCEGLLLASYVAIRQTSPRTLPRLQALSATHATSGAWAAPGIASGRKRRLGGRPG